MRRFLATTFFLLLTGSALAAEPLLQFAAETGEHLDFNAGDLKDVEWIEDTLNGSRGFRIQLDQPSAKLLVEFTLKLINKPMKLVVCGDLVANPVVREPVMGGGLQVMVETPPRAKMLAAVLRHGDCSKMLPLNP